MKLKHIDENSSMHPDDIYNSVRKTLASMKADRKPGILDPNANYAPTGDAASQEEKRFRQEYHRNQDERERNNPMNRLEEVEDELSNRRKDDVPPHPYRKFGTPVNKPPSDKNYPTQPFNHDDWMKTSKKMEEENDSLGNNWRTRKPPTDKQGGASNPDYPQKPFNKDEWMKSSKPMKEEEQLDELTNELLRRYKTAAAADAGESEKKAWDPESSHKDSAKALGRSNKRFSGIVKATKKQFDNDRKPKTEGMMGGINRCAPATDVSYEKVLDDGVDAEVQAAYGAAQAPVADRPIGFIVIDPKDNDRVMGKYRADGRSRANARRDKLDNAYGAYRYRVKPVYPGEEHLLKEDELEENKHRKKTQAQQGNFSDILKKQHQEKPVAQPAKAVTIPFHGWDIKYKPNATGQVDWVVIRGEKILQRGVANSDKEAVAAAEEWIKMGAGEKKVMNKNATIDFNKQFVSMIAPDAQPFYSTFVVQNGQPHLVVSHTPHEGLTKSSIRAGTNFPSIHVTPRTAEAVGLQPHGRYIIDVDNKEALDDQPEMTLFPLIFQGIIHDKSEREHLKGPGFTVAYPREKTEERLDPWHGYTPDDKKANAQARAPQYAKQGSVEVPFSELVCDSIRTHGMRWAFQFYVVKHGLPPRMFKIFAKDALENRE